MRFVNPAFGETRTHTYFAWIPVTVYHELGKRETRWLETVTVTEQYGCYKSELPYWKALKFVD